MLKLRQNRKTTNPVDANRKSLLNNKKTVVEINLFNIFSRVVNLDCSNKNDDYANLIQKQLLFDVY